MKKFVIAVTISIIIFIGSFFLINNHFKTKSVYKKRNYFIASTYRHKGYPFPMAFPMDTKLKFVVAMFFDKAPNVMIKYSHGKWEKSEPGDLIYQDIVIKIAK